MIRLFKKLFLIFFYSFFVTLLNTNSLLNECKALSENRSFNIHSNFTNLTNKNTQNKSFSNVSNLKSFNTNETTIEIDLFLELIKGQMVRLFKYLNRLDQDEIVSDKILDLNLVKKNQSNVDKINRLIVNHDEEEQVETENEEIYNDFDDVFNVSLNIVNTKKKTNKNSDSLEYINDLDLQSENEKKITKPAITSWENKINNSLNQTTQTDFSMTTSKSNNENNNLEDTTTVINDITVTKSSSKISTTLSLPYQENPYFMQCVNACGSDHECIRQKCLLDSTYFG